MMVESGVLYNQIYRMLGEVEDQGVVAISAFACCTGLLVSYGPAPQIYSDPGP